MQGQNSVYTKGKGCGWFHGENEWFLKMFS